MYFFFPFSQGNKANKAHKNKFMSHFWVQTCRLRIIDVNALNNKGKKKQKNKKVQHNGWALL